MNPHVCLTHALRHLLDHGPRFVARGDMEAVDIMVRLMDGTLPDVPFAEQEFPSSIPKEGM